MLRLRQVRRHRTGGMSLRRKARFEPRRRAQQIKAVSLTIRSQLRRKAKADKGALREVATALEVKLAAREAP